MHTRNCPKCLKELSYTLLANCKTAEKAKRLCLKCSSSLRDVSGNKNPFYGKKHSFESIEKIKKTQFKKGYKDTEDTKKKKSIAASGKNNSMYGKTIFDIWIDKYGVRISYQKIKEYKLKQSINSSGSNNPMYGKPTPKKSGNGISGWYKNIFFRSLRELFYIINILEPSNLQWQTCESAGIRVKYVNYDGAERTYTPDFLVDNKYIIEIKPKKLINSPLIKLKIDAIQHYCNNNNLEFKILDCAIPDIATIKKLETLSIIKFTEKSKERLLKYYA